MAARSAFKISDSVRDVLARSTITATSVQLPEQLDRGLYDQVNKALAGAGGRWDRKSRTHIFERDPRQVLGLAVETGEAVNLRTKFQAFYSTPPLAKRVVTAADLKHDMLVLEPSAGEGALVLEALRVAAVSVVMYDIDEAALIKATKAADAVIKSSGGSVRTELQDFLAVEPRAHFDAVIMNPPFTGGADMAHVTHAWRFLKPGGVLVAVTWPAWKTANTKAAKAFRELLATSNTEVQDIERGTFEHTDVATLLVVMRKPA